MSSEHEKSGGALKNESDHSLSRRALLKQSAAAVAGGAAMLGSGESSAAQAPAIVTGTQAGRRYRAFLMLPGRRSLSVETVKLRALQPNHVVIRSEAAHAPYTLTLLLNPQGFFPPANDPKPPGATQIGLGVVGIVEAVGSSVRRVAVGDRVITPVTPNCGQCWYCLNGRGDYCAADLEVVNPPIGDLADGTPVNYGFGGGFSDIVVVREDMTVPVATDVPPAQLSLLTDVMGTGLGLAMRRMPVEPGHDVLVLGAGPIGLSAVQGARIQGASQIIVVEPIPYRRELAMKVGATTVLDPNAFANITELQKHIVQLCTPSRFTRPFAGGRGPMAANGLGPYGPMYVLEAVGGDSVPPKEPAGPDPTGLQSLMLAWNVCPAGGVIRTCGVGFPRGSTVTIPAGQFSNSGKTHVPGNFAGVNTFRDFPYFVRLIEKGQLDAKSLVGQTLPFPRVMDAIQVAADRTSISAIVTFPS